MGRGPWGVSIHAFSALRCSNEIASTGYPVAVKAGEESNRINKQVRARDETVRRTHDPSRRICCQQRLVMDDLFSALLSFSRFRPASGILGSLSPTGLSPLSGE